MVIDEAGCLDSRTVNQLLEGTRRAARVLFVGDPDQLPSVAPGAVLRDLVASARVHHVELQTTHRNEEESGIPQLARSILKGSPDFSGSAVEFFERGEHNIEAEAAKHYREALGRVGPMEIQVLSPVNWLATRLNRRLQAECNADGRPVAPGLRVNDPVIAMLTTEQIAKGEIGRIVGVLGHGAVRIELGGGGIVTLDRHVVSQLGLAYCLTVHKAQGSEWRRVVVAFPECRRDGFLDRSLLYTAVTRARDAVVVVGSGSAVRRASALSAASQRETLLSASPLPRSDQGLPPRTDPPPVT